MHTLFSRTPAHTTEDIELGTLPHPRQATQEIEEERRRKRAEKVFLFKVAGTVGVIVGFWVVIGVKVYHDHARGGGEGV
jgi:uncharacterized membrane protein